MNIPINLDNPMHQYILVKLALIYYSAGDIKQIYEDRELFDIIAKEFKLGVNWTDAEIEENFDLNEDWPGFFIMGDFLNQEEVKHYYMNWELLKMMPDSKHMG